MTEPRAAPLARGLKILGPSLCTAGIFVRADTRWRSRATRGLRDEGLGLVRTIPDADELMSKGAAMTCDEIVAQVLQTLDAVDES